MLLTANVWRSTSAMQPMRFVPDTDEWQPPRAGLVHRLGRVDDLGGQMLIWPVMGAGVTATFAYLDKNCVTLAAAARRCVRGRRRHLRARRALLKLGMIWQWKARRARPTQEDMGTYGDALDHRDGPRQPGADPYRPPSDVGRGQDRLSLAGADMSQSSGVPQVPFRRRWRSKLQA
jgi:hypothetical protein